MVGSVHHTNTHQLTMGTHYRAVQHDEKVFDRPEEYYPERYLKDGKLDPHVRPPDIGAFGFGRR